MTARGLLTCVILLKNMNKWLTFLLLLPIFAQMQSRVWSQQIAYQSNVPKDIARATPQGVKSYFWGTFRLKASGPLYGVRLYDANWRKNSQNFQQGKNVTLYADLSLKSKGNWKRVRHCTLSYRGYIGRSMRIEMALLWLDPHAKQKPIIKIRAFGYEPPFREHIAGAGDEILVVFPNSIKEDYNVQVFAVGYWRASDTLGQDVSYATTDKRGLLQIITNESLNEENNPSRITTYQWKSGRFIAVSSRRSK